VSAFADAALHLHGTRSLVRLTGAQTAGRLGVLEEELPFGPGPPRHEHPQDETYVVLEGEATFWVGPHADPAAGDAGVRHGTGAVVHAPGGTPHTYRVESAAGLRVLILSTPAGLEDYVLALGRARADDPPPTRAELSAVARSQGQVLLGPPPPPAPAG
jgi:quercetin dioxygenase-like cupin family protein